MHPYCFVEIHCAGLWHWSYCQSRSPLCLWGHIFPWVVGHHLRACAFPLGNHRTISSEPQNPSLTTAPASLWSQCNVAGYFFLEHVVPPYF